MLRYEGKPLFMHGHQQSGQQQNSSQTTLRPKWHISTLIIYKQDTAVKPATQAVHHCARRITVEHITVGASLLGASAQLREGSTTTKTTLIASAMASNCDAVSKSELLFLNALACQVSSSTLANVHGDKPNDVIHHMRWTSSLPAAG